MVQTSLPMISTYKTFFKYTEGRERSSRQNKILEKYNPRLFPDMTPCSIAMVSMAFYVSSSFSITCRTPYQPFQNHSTPKTFTFD